MTMSRPFPTISAFRAVNLKTLRAAGGVALCVAALSASLPAAAHGLAQCDSGPKSGWQATEKLESQLKDKGWTVRRIKVDGGCYEVYALDAKGQRGEFYFHPVTLEPVPTKR